MSPRSRPALLPVLMLAALLTLSACESSEERAEGYYQSGLALLAAGDEERAMLEFRNVFDLNGFHKEARATYAALLVKRGQLSEAYGQYLRLIEQYPDTPEVRRDLAQLAILRGDWAEVERHGREALRLAPDDRTVQAIGLTLDYRTAALARDTAAQDRVAAAAAAFLAAPEAAAEVKPEGLPGAGQIARRLVIDRALAGPDPQKAMPVIEAAIAAEPATIEFHMLKLRLLAEAEDVAGTGAQLQAMVRLFPDNDEVKTATIGWYLAQRDIDGAEAFLRAEAGEPTADPAGHVAVIQLVKAARGADAARAEITRLAEANAGTANADLYGSLLATLDFEAGKTAEAVAAMEAIVTAAEPSDQTRRLKVMQARMLEAADNPVGARARIEEVLAEDPAQIEALKQRAAWRIKADDPGGAIVDLRAALDQAPRDPQILTMMAEAHERDGARDLAAERLALAVEVSGNRAEESLRYAEFLLRDRRIQPAVAVLTDARRVSPNDMRVLGALARVYLSEASWAEAQEVAAALRALPQPEAQAAADEVEAAVLLGQNRVDEGLSLLSGLVGDQTAGGSGDLRAVAMILETQIRAGRLAEARVYLDGILAERVGGDTGGDTGGDNPDAVPLRLMSAGLDALRGETALAEAQYRDLISLDPQAEAPVRLLYALLQSEGRSEDAAALLDTGLAAQPGSGTLRWMKAGQLEAAGDIDGAIAIYEALYEEDTSNVIVANNLASLITTYRSDPESLERAFAVARRLRGTDVPAFADTYGWIAFRRGDLDAALAHLEPAAAGLPGDPLVQYHLGMTYEALARPEDARRLYTRALAAAGEGSPLPQMADARTRLDALGGPLADAGGSGTAGAGTATAPEAPAPAAPAPESPAPEAPASAAPAPESPAPEVPAPAAPAAPAPAAPAAPATQP